MVQCYSTYTKATEDLEQAKDLFAESSGSGGDVEMKEMAREEASATWVCGVGARVVAFLHFEAIEGIKDF